MIELPQPTGADLWPPEDAGPSARLNKPWRALVAVVEVVLAAAGVWFAVVCWHAGIVTVVTTAGDGAVLTSHRYFGGLMAASLGIGIVAAILLVDAVRQAMLAVRTRPKPPNE